MMKALLLLVVLSGTTIVSLDCGAVLLHVLAYVACGLLAFYAAFVAALLVSEYRMRLTPARHPAKRPPDH